MATNDLNECGTFCITRSIPIMLSQVGLLQVTLSQVTQTDQSDSKLKKKCPHALPDLV